MLRRIGRGLKGALGAFMLGVGALFQLKRADEHWSDLPTVEVLVEAESADPSGDPGPDDTPTLPAVA